LRGDQAEEAEVIRQPAFSCASATVWITFLPLSTVCTFAVAAEPDTWIDSTVSVKSSIVLSWLSIFVWQLPERLSSLRRALARTCSQMPSPLAEFESLASRFRVVATCAF
jgi:hypothetical protein